MSARFLPGLVVLGLATVLGAGVGWVADRRAPAPSADVARGSEQAFLEGAYPRELTRQGPQRWTRPAARVRYEHLPPGAFTIELRLRAYTPPLHLFVNGAPVATWQGERSGLLPAIVGADGRLELAWTTPGRTAGGRALGVLFDRTTARPTTHAGGGPHVVLLFAGLALCAALSAWLAGCGARVALGGTGALLAVGVVALVPFGLLRSPYAGQLLGLLAGGALLAAVVARLHVPTPGSGRAWAWSAVLLAVIVQGVAATSPLMVVSDAVFHANKLLAVAQGDLFPTSVTQHATPFRFPYGVSLYAVLAPLLRLGFDPVLLVRAGAGASSVFASIALLGLLAERPRRAALAVSALQLLPATFEIYSYGNLSNVFAQALTVAFFAWWAGRARAGALLGALLLAAGCLAHFSGLVVLAALAGALLVMRWRSAGIEGGATAWRDRRAWAVILGLSLAALYYGQFLGLMVEQLPRLREGGGAGRGTGQGLLAALQHQGAWALARFGWPALLLAAWGWPAWRRPASVVDDRTGDQSHDAAAARLRRDLRAFWWAGGLLALCALLSPLEVRYLYALTAPLAVALADGVERAWAWSARGSVPRLWALRAALTALILLQAGLAGRELYEAIFVRYRV